MSLEDLKLKIKEEIPISAVIGHYLPLKKSGAYLRAVCPFHNDSDPSLNINDSKKLYKCFACGAAGDAIKFVMDYRHLDFVEALKDICQKQGINFESFQEERKSNPKMELAKKLLNITAKLYRNTATTKKFAPYNDFIKKRGLDEEIATTYNLGFAPSKNSLLDYINSIQDEKTRQEAFDMARELTLIKVNKNDSKSHYDTFRDRIIFPIWDQFGQIIGFTSRAIRDEQIPKYLNSSDSFIFSKNLILYGLHFAKSAIREKDAVIVVEGNMDQIALYRNGFTNSVALQGVAMGEASVDRLLSYTKNIILALDSDKPGYSAMEKINRMFNEKGIVPKILEFTPHKDADEFLLAHGKIALQEKIDNAGAAIDYYLAKLIPEKIPEVVDRKLDILHKAFDLVAPLRNELAATERVVSVAKRLGLKSEAAQIVKNYQDHLDKISAKEKNLSKFQTKTVPSKQETPEKVDSLLENEKKIGEIDATPLKIQLSKSEKQLVQELVQLPALLSEEKTSELLDLVSSDEVKKYIGKIRKILLEIDEAEYPSVIANLTSGTDISDELKTAVSSALFNYKVKEVDNKTKNKLLHDLKIKLQHEQLKLKKEELKLKQSECSSDAEMNELLKQIATIDLEIQKLKKLK